MESSLGVEVQYHTINKLKTILESFYCDECILEYLLEIDKIKYASCIRSSVAYAVNYVVGLGL